MNKRKKLLSWLLTFAMIFSFATALPMTAHGEDTYDAVINIVDGTGTGAGWTFASGEIWINENGSYFIDGDDGIQSSNRIQVKAGVTATVTLDNVYINVPLPFNCGDNSNVTIILVDDSVNTFTGFGGHAGLRVPTTATVTISTAGQSIGNGSLSAYGGADSSSNWASAGIGGSELEPSGTIVINGGTVFAKGGDGRPAGTWTGPGAAGIGGAMGRACGDITINGGNVTAIGGNVNPEGAGIGGGSSDPANYVGKITINGGTVRAYSGQTGASGTGIGFCSSIAIADTADVIAYSSGVYPAICGTTDTSGHSACLLSFMLDSTVTSHTDITITQKDNTLDTFELRLLQGYKNFATTVDTSNNYTADLTDGSKKIVSIPAEDTEFPGICDAPSTTLSSVSVKLKAYPVCMIDSTEYEKLDLALAAVASGQTIQLVRDITHNSTILIDSNDFHLNLDLNGHTLTVNASDTSCLTASNSGSITVINSVGDGMLIANTISDGSNGINAESYGSIVINAPLAINAMSSNSVGIRTYEAGSVTVMNAEINASRIGVEAYGDWNNHTEPSSISVTGNITTSSDSSNCGAYAYDNAIVTINGDVASPNIGLHTDGGTIALTGNLSTTRDDSFGVHANGGGSVTVSGDVNATGTGSYGAYVLNSSSVKIDGVINAPLYVNIGGVVLPAGSPYEPTTLAGYYTYADGSNLSNVVWVKSTVSTVTFNTNGGSTIESVTTNNNTGIDTPSEPTKTGYTFGGWYKESTITTAWDFATDKVTTDTTLYAKWIPNAYTIAFGANGGSGTLGAVGMVYDVSKALPTNTFTKTGYTFAGWATSPTGAVAYANLATVKNLTTTSNGAITLYAKWTPNTYTVKFNDNGVTTGSMASMPMTYNVSKTLTANAFKKMGYSFLGWATTSTGPVVYKDKALIKNLSATNKATVNLYAKWAAPITSAASYNYNSVKISWAAAGNATSYRIYRATSATGSYSLIKIADSSARSYVNTGLVTGKTYYFKVSVVAGGKTYHHSAYKSAKAIPATPTVALSKYSSTSIKVSWSGVTGATKYQIFRATSATGTYTYLYTASSTARSWVNTGLTRGKTYYYKVRAYHLEGTTKVYGISSAVKYLKI